MLKGLHISFSSQVTLVHYGEDTDLKQMLLSLLLYLGRPFKEV